MSQYLKIDDVKFSKALNKSTGDRYLALMALNVFNTQLGTGAGSFASQIKAQGPSWKPLSNEYRKRKQKQGLDTRIWVRTGKFLKTVSQPASKLGSSKGVKIAYKKSRKTATLDVGSALGNTKQKRVAELKRAAAVSNEKERKFVQWTDRDVDNAKKAAAKTLLEIFKREGLA